MNIFVETSECTHVKCNIHGSKFTAKSDYGYYSNAINVST